MNDTPRYSTPGPDRLLNLDTGTLEDHLAAVLEHHRLPKVGARVKYGKGKRPKVVGYEIAHTGAYAVLFFADKDHPRNVSIPAPEVLALEIIGEGEIDEPQQVV